MYTYIHTYINTYIHTYMHIYIHTNIHTYIHTYIHTCTYIHTYIHTYNLTSASIRTSIKSLHFLFRFSTPFSLCYKYQIYIIYIIIMNLCLVEFSSSFLNNIHSKFMNYFTLLHESSFRWHKSINPVVMGRKETITKKTLSFI